MKPAIVMFSLAFLFLQCGESENPTIVVNKPNIVKLGITTNTTKGELDSISTVFKNDHNIDINYSKTIFDKENRVESLNMDINCNDGHAGNVQAKRFALKQKNYGFERDYDKNAKRSFFTGAFE